MRLFILLVSVVAKEIRYKRQEPTTAWDHGDDEMEWKDLVNEDKYDITSNDYQNANQEHWEDHVPNTEGFDGDYYVGDEQFPPSTGPAGYPPHGTAGDYAPHPATGPTGYPPHDTAGDYAPHPATGPTGYPPHDTAGDYAPDPATGPAGYPPHDTAGDYAPHPATGPAGYHPHDTAGDYAPHPATGPAGYPHDTAGDYAPHPGTGAAVYPHPGTAGDYMPYPGNDAAGYQEPGAAATHDDFAPGGDDYWSGEESHWEPWSEEGLADPPFEEEWDDDGDWDSTYSDGTHHPLEDYHGPNDHDWEIHEHYPAGPYEQYHHPADGEHHGEFEGTHPPGQNGPHHPYNESEHHGEFEGAHPPGQNGPHHPYNESEHHGGFEGTYPPGQNGPYHPHNDSGHHGGFEGTYPPGQNGPHHPHNDSGHHGGFEGTYPPGQNGPHHPQGDWEHHIELKGARAPGHVERHHPQDDRESHGEFEGTNPQSYSVLHQPQDGEFRGTYPPGQNGPHHPQGDREHRGEFEGTHPPGQNGPHHPPGDWEHHGEFEGAHPPGQNGPHHPQGDWEHHGEFEGTHPPGYAGPHHRHDDRKHHEEHHGEHYPHDDWEHHGEHYPQDDWEHHGEHHPHDDWEHHEEHHGEHYPQDDWEHHGEHYPQDDWEHHGEHHPHDDWEHHEEHHGEHYPQDDWEHHGEHYPQDDWEHHGEHYPQDDWEHHGEHYPQDDWEHHGDHHPHDDLKHHYDEEEADELNQQEEFMAFDNVFGNPNGFISRCEAQQFCENVRHEFGGHFLSNQCCGELFDKFANRSANRNESGISFRAFIESHDEESAKYFDMDDAMKNTAACNLADPTPDHMGDMLDLPGRSGGPGSPEEFAKIAGVFGNEDEITHCEALFACELAEPHFPHKICEDFLKGCDSDGDKKLTRDEWKSCFVSKVAQEGENEIVQHTEEFENIDVEEPHGLVTRDEFQRHCNSNGDEGRKEQCNYEFEYCAHVSIEEAVTAANFEGSENWRMAMDFHDFIGCDFHEIEHNYRGHEETLEQVQKCFDSAIIDSGLTNGECTTEVGERREFCEWDTALGVGRGDGRIEQCEALYVCDQKGLPQAMCEYVFYACDTDGDGAVTEMEGAQCDRKMAVVQYFEDSDSEPCEYSTGCENYCPPGDSNCEVECQVNLQNAGCSHVEEWAYNWTTTTASPKLQGCYMREDCLEAYYNAPQSEPEYDPQYDQQFEMESHNFSDPHESVWDLPECQSEVEHLENEMSGEPFAAQEVCEEVWCDGKCHEEFYHWENSPAAGTGDWTTTAPTMGEFPESDGTAGFTTVPPTGESNYPTAAAGSTTVPPTGEPNYPTYGTASTPPPVETTGFLAKRRDQTVRKHRHNKLVNHHMKTHHAHSIWKHHHNKLAKRHSKMRHAPSTAKHRHNKLAKRHSKMRKHRHGMHFLGHRGPRIQKRFKRFALRAKARKFAIRHKKRVVHSKEKH